MKCPNCGAETDGNFCSYCGSELPRQQSGKPESSVTNSNNVINHITINHYESVSVNRPMTYQPYHQAQPVQSDKNKSTALLLCFFLGFLGGHLFYVGRWKKGLLYLFTVGLCGVGWFIDFFAIALNKFTDSNGLPIIGRAVAGKRVIYLTCVLLGITALPSAEQGSESGLLLWILLFMILFIISLIRKK